LESILVSLILSLCLVEREIAMLTLRFVGNSSAAESPFGGIKQSGYGKESGKDVAVNEYLITKTGTFTLDGQY
jgi:acyl-CoA reductase-like NAD-dependent aldehyde dehydrogenase